jgi:hypothetical protein
MSTSLAARSPFRQVQKDCHSFAEDEGLFKHRAPSCAFKHIPPVKENLLKASGGQFVRNFFDNPIINRLIAQENVVT